MRPALASLLLLLLALAGCATDRRALRRDRGLDRGLDRSGNPALWHRQYLKQHPNPTAP